MKTFLQTYLTKHHLNMRNPVVKTQSNRQIRNPEYTRGAVLFLISGLILLAGCASSINQRSFIAFYESVRELNEGTGTALNTQTEAAQERFVREALNNTGENLSSEILKLRLSRDDDDPFVYTVAEMPLFLVSEEFAAGIQKATVVLTDYANLLVQLASPDLLRASQFDSLSTELNNNAFTALTTVRGTTPDTRELALFSTAAAEMARSYLESQRREKLMTILRTNQETISRYSDHLVRGTVTMAHHAWQEYDEKAQDYLLTLAGNPSSLTQWNRQDAIEELIRLDRRHIATLRSLSAMKEAFAALPAAHAELIESLEKPESLLPAIHTLLQNGARIQRLHEDALRALPDSSKEGQSGDE